MVLRQRRLGDLEHHALRGQAVLVDEVGDDVGEVGVVELGRGDATWTDVPSPRGGMSYSGDMSYPAPMVCPAEHVERFADEEEAARCRG